LLEALKHPPRHDGEGRAARQYLLDASGLDASGLDASGLDAGGLDASGLDAGGLDASGLDASGNGDRRQTVCQLWLASDGGDGRVA
jgi:hypothetical protein